MIPLHTFTRAAIICIASQMLRFFSSRKAIADCEFGSVAAAKAASSSSAVVGNELSTSARIRASDLMTLTCKQHTTVVAIK